MKLAFIDPLRGKLGFLPLVGSPDIVYAVPRLLILSVLVSAVASLVAMRRFLEV